MKQILVCVLVVLLGCLVFALIRDERAPQNLVRMQTEADPIQHSTYEEFGAIAPIEGASEGQAKPGPEQSAARSPAVDKGIQLLLPAGHELTALMASRFSGEATRLAGSEPATSHVVPAGQQPLQRVLEPAPGFGALVFAPGVQPLSLEASVAGGEPLTIRPLAATRLSVSFPNEGVDHEGWKLRMYGLHGSSDPGGVGIPWGFQASFQRNEIELPSVPGWASVQVETKHGAAVWKGNLPVEGDHIQLEVAPMVSLRGSVEGKPLDVPGGTIRVRSTGSHLAASLLTCTLPGSGNWNMPAVPWVQEGTYTLRLEHPLVVPSEVEVVIDRPGGQGEATLQWEPGDQLKVRLTEPSGGLVPNAKVAIQWFVQGRWNRDERIADESGVAYFSAAPVGRIYIRAYKPGYAANAHGPFSLPIKGEAPLVVELSPVGRIKLSFPSGQAPSDDFVAQFRQVGGTTREVRLEPSGGPDFLLDQVPAGTIELGVQTTTSASRSLSVVEVIPDQTTEVLVPLVAHVAVSGRVNSTESAEPVPEAQIQALYCDDLVPPTDRIREPSVTDAAGRFHDLLVPPNGGVIWTTADGMAGASTYVQGPLQEGDRIPTITLAPLQPFRLTLRGAEQPGGTYYATWEQLFGAEKFPFSTNGALAIEECQPRRPGRLMVHTPDSGFYELEAPLLSGQEWHFDLVVDAERTVTLDLSELQTKFGAGWYHVRTEYLAQDGMTVSHTTTAEEGASVIDLQDLPRVECLITIAFGKTWVATNVVDLTEAGDHRLVIPFAQEPVGFELVYPAEERIDQVTGQFTQPASHGFAWFAPVREKGRVEVEFAVPGSGVYYATRFAPPALFTASVELAERGEEWHGVPFELPCTASLSLNPVSGAASSITVDVGFTDHWAVRRPFVTDAQGLLPEFRASEGRYTIQVTQPGFWREVYEFTLNPGSNSMHWDVRPTGGLRVECDGPSGAGQDIVIWSVADQQGATEWADRVASTAEHWTGPDGTLVLPTLPAGPYEVWVRGERDTTSKLVTVNGGSVATVKISL